MPDNDIEDTMPDVPLDLSTNPEPQAATEAPSTPTEDGKATEDKPEATEATKEEQTTEGESEEPAEADTSQAKDSETDAEEQKRINAEYAARRIQERQQTKQQVAQQLDQVYGPKTAEQLAEEYQQQGFDEQEARRQAEIQAIREEIQYERQRSTISELNAGMQADAVNAMADFPVFNEKSPEYDPEFAAMVQSQYQVAARLQTDDNGIILNAEVPLYDFYKTMNDIYARGSSKGASQAQKETLEVLSRTEDAGGGSSTNKGTETLDELGERLADLPIM